MGNPVDVSKYFLFIFNIIFALCGLALVIYGVLLKTNHREQTPIGLLVLGCIIFVTTFFGCWGAIKESTWMLLTFTTVLILLLIMQLLHVLVMMVGSKQLDMHTICKDGSNKYNTNTERFYDFQREHRCCGYDGPTDFANTWPQGTLPPSCCTSEKDVCRETDAEYHKRSCREFCNTFLGVVVITLLLVVGAVELFGIVLSIYLMCGLNKDHTDVQTECLIAEGPTNALDMNLPC